MLAPIVVLATGVLPPAIADLEVYAYALRDGDWALIEKLSASDASHREYAGWDVALDGGDAVVGATSDNAFNPEKLIPGSAYVFRFAGGEWTETQKLFDPAGKDEDVFGATVDIDGGRVVVGAVADQLKGDSAGAAYVYERRRGEWSLVQSPYDPAPVQFERFGYSVSISGAAVLVGAFYDDLSLGSAFVFEP